MSKDWVKNDIMLKRAKLTGSLRAKALWLAFGIFLIDQLSKYLSSHYLNMTDNIKVLPGFDLVLRHNTGAAFSFLAEASGWQRWFFVTIAIIMITIIVFWLGRLKENKDKWEALGLGFILGGALGNLMDRLVSGHVIDFILIYYKSWSWPAFNIADSAICIGVLLFLLDLFNKK